MRAPGHIPEWFLPDAYTPSAMPQKLVKKGSSTVELMGKSG